MLGLVVSTNGSGNDGRTILNGAGAPAAGLGLNGDFYIDPTAFLIYGPKTAGAWPAGVSYKGADGAGSSIVTAMRTHSANQPYNAGAIAGMNFDTAILDPDGLYTAPGGIGRFTIPVSLTGDVAGELIFDGYSENFLGAAQETSLNWQVYKNGVYYTQAPMIYFKQIAGNTRSQGKCVINVAGVAGDYFEIYHYNQAQTSTLLGNNTFANVKFWSV